MTRSPDDCRTTFGALTALYLSLILSAPRLARRILRP